MKKSSAQTKLTVALSGINASDNPGPGVPIARSLKEAFPQSTLLGLSYDVHDTGNYMDFLFHHTFAMPFPTKGWGPISERIQEIHKEHPIDLIIPSLDAELPLYILHQEELAQLGIKTFLPLEEQFQLRSKDQLQSVCGRFGLSHPKTLPIHSIDQLSEILDREIEFPCMIKGNFYKAYVVYNKPQAILKFHEIASEWGYPILIQEFVSGKEINLIGLADGKGGSCGLVAVKKLTTTHLGKIWTAVTIKHDALIEYGKRFIEATNWRGPFELECIESQGKIHLIEINPRFPAWVYFASAIGVNLPERLIDLVLYGDCERESRYEAGKLLVRYSYEIVTDLTRYSQLLVKNGL